MRARSRLIALLASLTVALGHFAQPALAHVGGLGGAVSDGNIPTWLTIVTGGVIVGASFLFTSLLTDHEAIRMVTRWRGTIGVPSALFRRIRQFLGVASVVVLVSVIVSGLIGPGLARQNFAIVVVWAGWWAGYTMSVYAIGNTWPALNPWRTVSNVLPRIRSLSYPEHLGAWPSTVGLLVMVWIEVVSPVASDPTLLALLVLLYTSITLAGAAVLGTETWFARVDPVARVFRCYGRVAPVTRTDDGLTFSLPTSRLTDWGEDEINPTPFVIALLWVTTYDGLVSTPLWDDLARGLVGVGVPALVLYLATLAGGYAVFYGIYRFAARRARRAADTYTTASYVERYFAPTLLPIAVGYHAAHFLGYSLTLAPTLVAVVSSPLTSVLADPAGAPILTEVAILPDWFGLVQLGLVLTGHVLAVWVAHARSFELFPGVLTPIRSQYPITIAMIAYTILSMWVVIQPFVEPPFV